MDIFTQTLNLRREWQDQKWWNIFIEKEIIEPPLDTINKKGRNPFFAKPPFKHVFMLKNGIT